MRKPFIAIAAFLFFQLCCFCDDRVGTVVPYQSQIEGSPKENFGYAAVQLWIPPNVKKLRGILCLILHPIGHGGSTLAYPGPWIELVRRENCAVMSISFAQSDDPTRDWCRAEQGTGRALLASLSGIAHESGFSDLTTAPLVAVGVCAAGQFAFHLAAFTPGRVASFVTIGGGKHDLSRFKATTSMPALLVMTPDRGPGPAQNLRSLYAEGKSLSAPWQFASEPIAKYDAGFCSSQVISYLRQRLNSLKSVDSENVDATSESEKASVDWLPISICGVKLPSQIVVKPSAVDLGTINFRAGVQVLSFTLVAAPNSPADSLWALGSDKAIQYSVSKDGLGRWQLTCRLDPMALPLGPFMLSVKLRCLAENKLLLGGTSLTFSGSISGPVSWHPLGFNFGSVEAGQTATASVRIDSSDGDAVQIKEMSSPYPWIKAIQHIGAKSTIIECVARPPTDAQDQVFAGYLRVELLAPIHRCLKVFCYGSIRNPSVTQ